MANIICNRHYLHLCLAIKRTQIEKKNEHHHRSDHYTVMHQQ